MLIKEIVLNTSADIKKLKIFYEELIGLEVLKYSVNTISFAAGSSILSFEFDTRLTNPFYHFAFSIPTNKFKEAKEYLLSLGIELISLNEKDEFEFQSWNAHSVYFYDPAGNILEFISGHNLKNESDLVFDGNSILSICEIGLPVSDVNSFYNEIQNEFDLPFFSGDKKSFTAMGDEYGLLILVNTGRIWFPDCEPAKEFPLKIIIKSGKDSELFNKINKYHIISET